MININFAFKKMLTFTQQSAKSDQNHFQLQVKKEKPWTHMIKVWNINSAFQTIIQYWKQHLQQDKQKTDQAAAINKHSLSLLRKMKQQKKLSIHFALVATNPNSLVQCLLTARSQKHLFVVKQNVNTLNAMA